MDLSGVVFILGAISCKFWVTYSSHSSLKPLHQHKYSRSAHPDSTLQSTTKHERVNSSSPRHHHHQHKSRCSKPPTSPGGTAMRANVGPTVERLAQDIIREFVVRERAIGYGVHKHTLLLQQAHAFFQEIFAAWQSSPPSIQTFLLNVTLTLNRLKVLSSSIVRRLEKLSQLGNSSGDITVRFVGADITPKLRRRRNVFKRTGKAHKASSGRRVGRHRRERSIEDSVNGSYWDPMEKTVAYLDGSEAWYTFLEELSNVLGSYENQKSQSNAEEGQFSGWVGKGNINKKNLKEALQRIEAEYQLSALGNSTVTADLLVLASNQQRLVYLNEIIRATLLSQSSCTFSGEFSFTVGAYVLLSDVIKCTKPAVHQVVAVSANKIFIDTDVNSSQNQGSTFSLTLIAPYLEIVGGSRVLNVSGPPGRSSNQNDGRPGYPGVSGGNIFVIAYNISNNTGNSLQIISNGGAGGNGHNGGHHPVQISCGSPYKEQDAGCQLDCETGCEREPCDCSECDYTCCPPPVNFIQHGLNGGQAGIGGYGGYVEVILSTGDSPKEVTVEQGSGANGSVGAGAKGKSSNSPPSPSELAAAGIKKINNKNNFCAMNDSSVLPPSSGAKDGQPGKDPRPPKPPLSSHLNLRSVVLGIIKLKGIILNSSQVFSRPGALDVMRYLDNNATIQEEYNSSDFVGEYLELEKQDVTIRSRYVLPHLFYGSLSKRCLRRVQRLTEKDDIFRLLSFLYSAALSKKLITSQPYDPDTSLNTIHFVAKESESLEAIFKEGRLRSKFSLTHFLHKYYREHVQKSAEQALKITTQLLVHETVVTEEYFKNTTARLLTEIKKLKEGQANEASLKDLRERLLAHNILNTLFSVSKLAAISVSFWNPVGAAIALGANLSYSVSNVRVQPNYQDPEPDRVNLPGFVQDANSRGAFHFRDVTASSFRGLVAQLNAASGILKGHASDYEAVLQEIERVKTTASAMIINPGNVTDSFPPQDCVNSFKLLFSGWKYVMSAQRNITTLINIKSPMPTDASRAGLNEKPYQRDNPPSMQEAGHLAQAIFSMDPLVFYQIGPDSEDVLEVAQQLAKAPEEVNKLAAHSRRIQSEIIPDMKNMLLHLIKHTTVYPDDSVLSIRWRMQSAVLDSKLYFKQVFSKSTDSYVRAEQALELLDEATTSFIRFSEHLQDYYDQILVFHFVGLALSLQESAFYFGSSSNSTVEELTQLLRYNLLGTLLLKRHQALGSMFRYQRFPIVTARQCELTDGVLIAAQFSNIQDIQKFLKILIAAAKEMLSIIRQGSPEDQIILGVTKLFTWTNKDHGGKIASLLQGKQITLFSNVYTAIRNCDAFKLHKMDITFTSPNGNATLDKWMEEALRQYYVSTDHQGTSYYLVGNEAYVLPGSVFSPLFSFAKRNGVPTYRNGHYSVLVTGNFTLGPFAIWTLQLGKLKNPGDFSNLADKVNLFDMHLLGNGTCVTDHVQYKEHYSPDCSDYFPNENDKILKSPFLGPISMGKSDEKNDFDSFQQKLWQKK